jgi:hypothetical protein
VTVRAAVEDENGTSVQLTEERWEHLAQRHPEIERFAENVLQAVGSPDRSVQGREANERWYYLKTGVPGSWLKVVVAYAEGRGHIVTAHARRWMP